MNVAFKALSALFQTSLAAAVLLPAAAAQQPMPKDARPRLEVTTVKPTPPDERNQGFQTRGSHIRLVRQTVQSMIMFAYGVHGKQIANAPDWVGSVAFDVDAIPDVAGEPNVLQWQMLMKQLLVERFGLRLHPAQHEMSYYALRVVPGGAKLVKSASPEDASPDQTGSGSPKGMTMKYTNNSMPEFALGMQYFTDRPIVDKTGLTARYDFQLQWATDTMKATEDDAFPNLFTAMREQLGLELKPAKGPVEVMVVDVVSAPSEN